MVSGDDQRHLRRARQILVVLAAPVDRCSRAAAGPPAAPPACASATALARSRPSTLNWMPMKREFVLAVDERRALADLDVGELAERQVLAVGRGDQQMFLIASMFCRIRLLQPDHEVERPLALDHLRRRARRRPPSRSAC